MPACSFTTCLVLSDSCSGIGEIFLGDVWVRGQALDRWVPAAVPDVVDQNEIGVVEVVEVHLEFFEVGVLNERLLIVVD